MFIPTKDNIKTVTDMRENALALLRNVQKKEEPTIILHRSKPQAVLLSLKEYLKLQELLEDYADALEAIEMEKNPEEGGQSLEEVAKELGIRLPSKNVSINH